MSRMLLFVLVACLAACESHDPGSAADRLACRGEVAKKFPDTASATGILYERRQARSEKAYDDCLRARKEEEPTTEESAKASAAAATSPMSCADPSCMTDEEQLRRLIVACDATGVNRPGSNQAALAQCIQHMIEVAKPRRP
jgi:hypothetical protein